MPYTLILKSLHGDEGRLILAQSSTLKEAEWQRKLWRKALGGRNWTIDRRPGLDTLDHLALTIITQDLSQ